MLSKQLVIGILFLSHCLLLENYRGVYKSDNSHFKNMSSATRMINCDEMTSTSTVLLMEQTEEQQLPSANSI